MFQSIVRHTPLWKSLLFVSNIQNYCGIDLKWKLTNNTSIITKQLYNLTTWQLNSRRKSPSDLSYPSTRKTLYLYIVIFLFPLSFLCFSWLVTEAKPLLITPSSCWCPSTFTLRVLLLLSQIKAHIHINIKVLNKAKYIVKQKMTNRFQAYLVLARFSTSAAFARCRAVDISTLTWTTSSAIWFSLDATRALAFTMFNLR